MDHAVSSPNLLFLSIEWMAEDLSRSKFSLWFIFFVACGWFLILFHLLFFFLASPHDFPYVVFEYNCGLLSNNQLIKTIRCRISRNVIKSVMDKLHEIIDFVLSSLNIHTTPSSSTLTLNSINCHRKNIISNTNWYFITVKYFSFFPSTTIVHYTRPALILYPVGVFQPQWVFSLSLSLSLLFFSIAGLFI